MAEQGPLGLSSSYVSIEQQQELKRARRCVDNRLASGASHPGQCQAQAMSHVACRISHLALLEGAVAGASVVAFRCTSRQPVDTLLVHTPHRPLPCSPWSTRSPLLLSSTPYLLYPQRPRSIREAPSAADLSFCPLPSRHGSGCVLSDAHAGLTAHEAYRCSTLSPRVLLAPLADSFCRPRPREPPHR